jgi:hypothetical protein
MGYIFLNVCFVRESKQRKGISVSSTNEINMKREVVYLLISFNRKSLFLKIDPRRILSGGIVGPIKLGPIKERENPMKMIKNIDELRKGASVIVKDCPFFEAQGFTKISGDVFEIQKGNNHFTLKCRETESIEKITIESGKIFLLD